MNDLVGVKAISGSMAIDANMGGEYPDTADGAKVAAVTSLARTIIARLL